jgi:hypothetical protein
MLALTHLPAHLPTAADGFLIRLVQKKPRRVIVRRGFFIRPAPTLWRDTVSQCLCFDLHRSCSPFRSVGLS